MLAIQSKEEQTTPKKPVFLYYNDLFIGAKKAEFLNNDTQMYRNTGKKGNLRESTCVLIIKKCVVII